MAIGSVIVGVLIVGALVGVAVIGSVVLVYLRSQKLGQGGTLMMFGGIVLFGLSAWQSFEFTAGQVTLKATSVLRNVDEARSVNRTSVQIPPSSSGTCEQERTTLMAQLQIQLQKQKQIDELLNNIEKAANDLTMTPIRNLR